MLPRKSISLLLPLCLGEESSDAHFCLPGVSFWLSCAPRWWHKSIGEHKTCLSWASAGLLLCSTRMKANSAEALSSPATGFMHNTQQFCFPGEVWEEEGRKQSKYFASFSILFPNKSSRNYKNIKYISINIWAKTMTGIAESKKLRWVFLGQVKMCLPPHFLMGWKKCVTAGETKARFSLPEIWADFAFCMTAFDGSW